MKIQPGDVVLLTGASGGLGIHFVKAFAKLGARLVLASFPGNDLQEIRAEVEKLGCESIDMICDLRDPAQRVKLVELALNRFGRVDVLVNNAGVEFTAFYHELSEDQIASVLSVNLEAPMLLTRLLLPAMLAQKRGHIINISSLAGKSGPAYQEPYAATKAGLVAFTLSLRSTYRSRGVSASAIVPGFVEAGIYSRLKAQTGMSAPAWLGTSQPAAVVQAVLRAIVSDPPEMIVNPIPVRPLLAFTALFPRTGEWLTGKIGANDFFRRAVEKSKQRAG
jgi:NAD(P)-dependent dehydrogenase (short-subunit alcohol dehydrogenase family)